MQQSFVKTFHHASVVSLHYLVKYSCSKNRHAQRISAAKCRVKLSHSKTVKNIWWNKQYLVPWKKAFTSAILKIAWPTVHNFCNKEKDVAAKCRRYMISSRSVTDGVSLSVSMSKLVCGISISVDNRVKRICLLTLRQLETFSVRHAQVVLLMCQILHLWGKKRQANGAHGTINHFVRNFTKYSSILKNSFTSKLNNNCAVKQHIIPWMHSYTTL